MAESSYKKFSQLLLLLLRDMEGMIVISCKVIALQFSEIQNNYFCWTSRKLLIMFLIMCLLDFTKAFDRVRTMGPYPPTLIPS